MFKECAREATSRQPRSPNGQDCCVSLELSHNWPLGGHGRLSVPCFHGGEGTRWRASYVNTDPSQGKGRRQQNLRTLDASKEGRSQSPLGTVLPEARLVSVSPSKIVIPGSLTSIPPRGLPRL